VPHITIEHVILVPVLFAQILIFPLAASFITSTWTNAQRNAELQDAANLLASTIQQLYLSVNRKEILAGNITQASTLPPTIDSYSYKAVGSLMAPLDPNSSRVLTLSLTLERVRNTATANAVLGPNVLWLEGSVFESTSPNASVKVQKFTNGNLLFSFG